jgi:hypothetical protein
MSESSQLGLFGFFSETSFISIIKIFFFYSTCTESRWMQYKFNSKYRIVIWKDTSSLFWKILYSNIIFKKIEYLLRHQGKGTNEKQMSKNIQMWNALQHSPYADVVNIEKGQISERNTNFCFSLKFIKAMKELRCCVILVHIYHLCFCKYQIVVTTYSAHF